MDLHFLASVAQLKKSIPHLSQEEAIQTLGSMKTQWASEVLVELLEDEASASKAYEVLSKSVYLFDAFYAVVQKHRNQNPWATRLLRDWTCRKWLTEKPALPEAIDTIVYKVPGTVTCEMLSPLKAAWSRSDTALHAQSFLKNSLPDAIYDIQNLKETEYPIAFVTDEIETRKARVTQCQSAVEALLWHIKAAWPSDSIARSIILSQRIDHRFHDIAEAQGALLLFVDTHLLKTGDVIRIWPYRNSITLKKTKEISFKAKEVEWQSIWRMESRRDFLLGHTLTHQAKINLKENFLQDIAKNSRAEKSSKQYTLGQKLIGQACGREGVQPGEVCMPIVSTLALSVTDSYNEKDDIGYSTDLIVTQCFGQVKSDSKKIMLKANDGKMHAWMHRLLLPDHLSVSHDPWRSATGISLPPMHHTLNEIAITGCLPITVPASVLIQFQGKKHTGIKVRDLIHSITYFGLQKGFFKKENGYLSLEDTLLEIEGLEALSCEAAFEFTESSTSYNTFACAFSLDLDQAKHTAEKNVLWLKECVEGRYSESAHLKRRLSAMLAWLKKPHLLKRDPDAQYQKILKISLEDIQEPLISPIQNPTQIIQLSELTQQKTLIDEVWVGATALNLEHYRVVADLLKKHAVPLKTRLWVAPPSPLELKQLMREGCYQIYGKYGVYTEMPEDAMCTQSRFKPGAYIVATSPHAFSKQQKALLQGYITSPEIATLTAILGRLPTLCEYRTMIN